MILRRPRNRVVVNCVIVFSLVLFVTLYFNASSARFNLALKKRTYLQNDTSEHLKRALSFGQIITQPAIKCEQQLAVPGVDLKMSSLYDEIPFDNKDGGVWKQGFNISYHASDWDDRNLEVIVLPHSHQDPGWIKTLDEYFEQSTHKGLDATLNFLDKNPASRFVYAEVVFLDKWWQNLSTSMRTLFTKLVRDGRWEIATGGWIVNDEASTHYGAAVSQLIEGHHWMLNNIGVLPNVSWVIDVFGHSTTQAYILRKAGLKNAVIRRVHYEVKKALAEKQNLQFVWRQPWDAMGESEIFTHVMPFFSYDIPHTCGPDPSICCQFDFMRSRLGCPWGIQPKVITESNVQERSELLLDQYRKKAKLYKNHNVLLVPLGDDFRYLTYEEWDLQVSNYQRIMDYINSVKSYKAHVRFGTLSEYFNLVHSRSKFEQFPTFHGDFFTYADVNQDYWNGCFTSRPAHKAFSRSVEAEVRNADILFSLARHWTNASTKFDKLVALYDKLISARRNLASFQHHDAITGTSKSYVMADFYAKLQEALHSAEYVSASCIAFLLGYDSPEVLTALEHEVSTNTTPVLSSVNPRWLPASAPELVTLTFDGFQDFKFVYIFNPLPRGRDHVLRLQVNMTGPLFIVKQQVDRQQTIYLRVELENQTLPISAQLEPWNFLQEAGIPVALFRLTAGPIHLGPFEVLRVRLRPEARDSLSSALMIVKPMLYGFTALPSSIAMFYAQRTADLYASELESDVMLLTFDKNTGFAQELLNKKTGESHELKIGFELRKVSATPGSSGAYLGASFASEGHLDLGSLKMRTVHGLLTDEISTFYRYVNHTLRLYKSGTPQSLSLEVENVVNLATANDGVELVMILKTGIQNTDGVFFTDSNCYQMVQRKFYSKIPQWGNVYPMSCAAFIEDGRHRVTVLSGQSLGVTAGEHPGEIKIWLDRKAMSDDLRGMGEAMKDAQPSRSVFRILVENILPPTNDYRFLTTLTAEAHFVLNDLNFPGSQFLTNFDARQLVAKQNLMHPIGLPCDYDLVAMKTFFSKSERFKGLDSVPSSQLGLILHRTAYACGSTYLCDGACVCTPSNGLAIQLPVLFPHLIPTRAIKTPLTLIPDKSISTSVKAEVIVGVMEMEGFLLVPPETQINVAWMQPPD